MRKPLRRFLRSGYYNLDFHTRARVAREQKIIIFVGWFYPRSHVHEKRAGERVTWIIFSYLCTSMKKEPGKATIINDIK